MFLVSYLRTWHLIQIHEVTYACDFIYFILYVYFACIAVYHMHAVLQGGHKRPLDPLELELQMIVISHVWAGNQTWIPWKSSKCP